jgi:hypothetical protein
MDTGHKNRIFKKKWVSLKKQGIEYGDFDDARQKTEIPLTDMVYLFLSILVKLQN